MPTFFIIAIIISTIGILSYFSSAWFGFHGSGFDKLPPHYRHLRLRQDKSTETEDEAEESAEIDKKLR